MNVHVREARHDEPAFSVKHIRAIGNAYGATLRHRRDHTVRDEHIGVRPGSTARTVDEGRATHNKVGLGPVSNTRAPTRERASHQDGGTRLQNG